jgi:hypothetical protein
MSKKWLLAFLLAATPAAAPAVAHDWYPLECCHEMDCAPVDRTEIVPTPTADPQGAAVGQPAMIVTTRHGSVLVPGNFPRRESKDHRMHACMMPGVAGQMQLICIFMPPSM